SLFHQLLEAYPDYRRNDTVLYQLARAYEIAGKMDDALRVLNELVQKYPGTALIDEVQFRRGEMLFLKKDYIDAEAAYQEVVVWGESSRFYEQALYKLGWSQFKLAMHEDSLQPFFELLDRKISDVELQDGDDRLIALSRAEREIVEDTFRVLSISFSYMDGAESIAEALAERGYPDYGYVIFMNLGDLYLEKQRFIDAAETYEAFVDQDPYHPKAPLLQVEVIEAYKLGGFPTLVLEGKKGFVERYGMDGPFWVRNPRESNTAVEAHLKANLTDLAQYYHAEAQKDGKRSDYQEAARWYRLYLDYFPGEADSANTNFLLAEILFESQDFDLATDEYERTAYEYPLHEHSSEAAYAAILSYRAHEETLDELER
ncbi:MAG: tetratricopeptide repeat protein, partial [Woeseiaceae bacterium]